MEKNHHSFQETYLIIGAGPAGLVTGILLSRMGKRVQIIERFKEQQRNICGEYLSPQGVNILKELNLYQTIEQFQQTKGMSLFSTQGTQVLTTFPKNYYGISLNRKIFQNNLSDIFLSLGGKIHYDHQLEFIKTSKEGYEIKTNKSTFYGKFLIGADGRQSSVGRLLGFKTEAPKHKKLALHCYLKPKAPLSHFGQMHILPNGSYIGINPISPEEVNFSIVTSHHCVLAAGGEKELINFWIKKMPGLNNQFNPLVDEKIKATSPIGRRANDIRKGHALLIGDASGFIDPLTGEGMTTAIKTARILCDEIKKSSSPEIAFEHYEKRRRIDFKNKEKLNYGFQKIIQSNFLCEVIAQILGVSKRLADTFIGVVGNIYDPLEAIVVLIGLYLKQR
jgi:2-polyprenyl-6-methoxyphenol hydroxylase-like FAD-dependent oxidoreductase